MDYYHFTTTSKKINNMLGMEFKEDIPKKKKFILKNS